MRAYLFGALLFALSFVQGTQGADYFPADFRGLPGSIYARWDFDSSANPSPVDDFQFVPLGSYPLFPIAPTADPMNMGWYGGADYKGWVSLPGFAILNFNMPNFMDEEPLKKLWIQITYLPLTDPELYPFVAAIEAYEENTGFLLGELEGSYTIPELGYRVESWSITPNPDFELVQIYLPPWILVDQVIIDTISTVPEVSSIAMCGLGMLGMGGFAALRRRRSRTA